MTTTNPTTSTLSTLLTIEQELQQDFYEREDVIRAALVALLSRSHMVLLGLPGTAKSELINALSSRFGLSFFVYLMTRFTTPDEVFGPVSLDGMKQGTYERVTIGKAPEAQIIFLDEVFKSSSAIMNCFLTMQQERVFDNGITRNSIPLEVFFGASNELPQGEDTAAAWDRYLLRLDVSYLNDGNFEKLLLARAGTATRPLPTTLSQAELFTLQQQAQAIRVPPAIVATLVTLRRELKEEKGIIASDRRWVQCLQLIKAYALMEGHLAVEEEDLTILIHALWNLPEQRAEISKKINKLANPFNARSAELKDEAIGIWEKAKQDMKQYTGDDEASSMNVSRIIVAALKKINTAKANLQKEKRKAEEQGRNTNRIDQAITTIEGIRTEALSQAGV